MAVRATTAMKWCAWALLAITFALLALVMYENRPQPIVLPPPPGELAEAYPAQLPAERVGEWVLTGGLVLGSVVVWALVVWRRESLPGNVFALVVAGLYCGIAIPIYLHHCVFVGGGRYFYPPGWVFRVGFAVAAFGWLVGIPLLVLARYQRRAFKVS